MTSTLQQALIQYVHQTEEREVLATLGYRPDADPALERLREVLQDPGLGLSSNSTAFDLRYSSKAYVRALADLAGLDELWVDAELKRIQAEIETLQARFKSYLWIDTHFKCANQPIFALAACEQFRYIHLDQAISHWPLEQQLAHVAPIIREHYAEADGKLTIWGKIQTYWYYCEPERAVILGPDGKAIGSASGPVPARARLRLA